LHTKGNISKSLFTHFTGHRDDARVVPPPPPPPLPPLKSQQGPTQVFVRL
jgi:hypothetical protein